MAGPDVPTSFKHKFNPKPKLIFNETKKETICISNLPQQVGLQSNEGASQSVLYFGLLWFSQALIHLSHEKVFPCLPLYPQFITQGQGLQKVLDKYLQNEWAFCYELIPERDTKQHSTEGRYSWMI